MDDEKIIELYWRRDETAIACTDEKYGRLCRKISDDILSSREDSEECVADTYLALWNCIPPQRPSRFRAFIAAVTRNLSLKRLRSRAGRHRDNRAGGRNRSKAAISKAEQNRLPSFFVICFIFTPIPPKRFLSYVYGKVGMFMLRASTKAKVFVHLF